MNGMLNTHQMRIIAWFVTGLCLLATLLPLIQSPYWWIRIFDFARLYVALLCLPTVGLLLRYRPAWWPGLVLLLLGTCGYQASYILDYTPLRPVQARVANQHRPQSRFRLLVSNVRMENRQAGAFLKLVSKAQPDLLLVNEPDAWWADQLRPLWADYPYRVERPIANTYGMILLSRLPLLNSRIRYLVEPDIPSIWTGVRLPSGQTFELYCLHPRPPKPGTLSYERDAELLLVGRHLREKKRPAVVAGDLNDVGWSRTSRLFQRYSGLVDPRRGRGLYNTYNANVPLFRYPLDHIFYSDDFGLVHLERLPDIGSDHFPVLIELGFEPNTQNTQNQPERKEGDKRRVREKIRQGQNP